VFYECHSTTEFKDFVRGKQSVHDLGLNYVRSKLVRTALR